MKTTFKDKDLIITVEDAIPANDAYAQKDITALAACAAPNGSDDPGDKALWHAAKKNGAPLNFAQKEGSWQAPTDNRPYSLTRLKATDKPNARPFTVARGDAFALARLCRVSKDEVERLKKAFKPLLASGYRPVGVAILHDDEPWRFQGIVPVHAMRRVEKVSMAKANFRYFHLWDWQLRVLHWLWVICIAGLCVTGFFIGEGWFLKMGVLDNKAQFGIVRLTHYALGWALIVIMLLRFICFFRASNKYQRIPALFPLSKRELTDLILTARDYLLARSYDGPRYIGHNPLQQWSYTGIYGLFMIMIVSGLSLYALYNPNHWFYGLFMPLNDLVGVPNMRLIHNLGMWCFIIFAMIHIHLAILAGNVDRDGTISSMFSGGRWLRKGVKFRDE